MIRRLTCYYKTGLQRSGLNTHVREYVDHRLLDVRSVVVALPVGPAIVIRGKPPRPKDGTGPENKCTTGRIAILNKIMGCSSRSIDATELRIKCICRLHSRRRKVDQPSRHESVVRRGVPLVAQEAWFQGRRSVLAPYWRHPYFSRPATWSCHRGS